MLGFSLDEIKDHVDYLRNKQKWHRAWIVSQILMAIILIPCTVVFNDYIVIEAVLFSVDLVTALWNLSTLKHLKNAIDYYSSLIDVCNDIEQMIEQETEKDNSFEDIFNKK